LLDVGHCAHTKPKKREFDVGLCESLVWICDTYDKTKTPIPALDIRAAPCALALMRMHGLISVDDGVVTPSDDGRAVMRNYRWLLTQFNTGVDEVLAEALNRRI
ncbi:MAG: hypothetical protein WCG37_11130, partial [Actinomycetes bacterium]